MRYDEQKNKKILRPYSILLMWVKELENVILFQKIYIPCAKRNLYFMIIYLCLFEFRIINDNT